MPPTARPPEVSLANWDLGGTASAWSYRHGSELFNVRELRPGRRPALATSGTSAHRQMLDLSPALTAELDSRLVQAVTIIAGGQVIMQWAAGEPADDGDGQIVMSVSKVFASIAVGLLEDRGVIGYDAPIREFLPELGDQWQPCTVQHILDMSSGVECPEVGDPGAYLDSKHPFYQFEASLGWRPTNQAVSPYDLVRGFRRTGVPGSQYECTSVNTFFLSWLVERVTEKSYPDALQELIWDELALNGSSAMCVSDTGVAVSHGGLIMSADDLARFGTVFTPSGSDVGHRLTIPTAYLDLLRAPRRGFRGTGSSAVSRGHPGAQWNCIHPDGDMFKSGFGGQGLYVSPSNDVVIAFLGIPDQHGRTNGLSQLCRDLVPIAANDP